MCVRVEVDGKLARNVVSDRGVTEDAVVPIESFEHRLGDVKADL